MRQLISNVTKKIRPKPRRTIVIAGLAGVIVIAAALVYLVVSLNRTVSSERDRQASSSRVEVEEKPLRAPSSDGLTLFLNAADVRAVASFEGSTYLATSGGLIELKDGSTISRRYTTFDGLPDNDLTTLAVFRERLFVGTSSAGLVAFDGHSFTGFRFANPKATRISVLLPTVTELLIGTLDGGLFEYDGQRFTRRVNSAAGADFSRVTALLPVESRLYIGTQDKGLYIWREAHIEHIGPIDGLPSPRVTGIAAGPAGDGSVAVATDFGVVTINDRNELKTLANRPNITSLAVSGGHLWAGLFNGGIVDLNASAENDGPSSVSSEATGLPRSAPSAVSTGDEKLWVLTTEGAFSREQGSTRPKFEAVAASLASERLLTAAHITSLAFDSARRLWVGYFDRGIDLITTESNERLSHVEDDRVRELNYLAFDTNEDRMLAATSRGLVSISGNLKQSVMTREQGLINESVAHVSFGEIGSPLLATAGGISSVGKLRGRGLVVSTAGGLTEIVDGRSRSITAFHGLASNHLYTSAVVGSRLFVGSLAGLVELEGLRVVRVYKTSNSRLSHDWVTAIVEGEGTLYVGTNGGGVDALLPTGEWVNFSDELGRFEVNQNAMHFDGERLYVGTSDRGLLVYNTRGRRWSRISAGLASQNVTAITSDDRFVFAGTMNGLVRIEKRVSE